MGIYRCAYCVLLVYLKKRELENLFKPICIDARHHVIRGSSEMNFAFEVNFLQLQPISSIIPQV